MKWKLVQQATRLKQKQVKQDSNKEGKSLTYLLKLSQRPYKVKQDCTQHLPLG